jgi:hypothetical protein
MAKEDIISGLGASIGNAANGLDIGFGKGGFSLSANFNQRKQKALTKSRSNSPLKELYAKNADDPQFMQDYDYIFPADLDVDHYIRFDRIERVRQKENGDENTNVLNTTILPLPSNLSPQYSANYKDQEMGVAGALSSGVLSTGEVASAVDRGLTAAGNGFQEFTNFITGGQSSEAVQKDIKQIGSSLATIGAAGALGSLAGGNIGAIIGATVGGAGTAAQGAMSRFNKTLNSHLAVLFDGVGFRSFQFNYRFIPRSQDEAEELKGLIWQFKRAMYPSLPKENKFLFTYPDEFQISFSKTLQPNMFKFKRSVLKDMQVNYNGDGVPRFFDDGNPVVVDISMTFQEVEIVTKEDLESPEDSA